MSWQSVGAVLVGIFVGFLGGLFGKGGSAVATPLLSLIGFPGFVSVAAPLPATVPGTLIASFEYWHSNLLDWDVFWWSVAVGVPAATLGGLLSKVTGAGPLLIITALLVAGFGVSFLLRPSTARRAVMDTELFEGDARPSHWKLRLAGVAAGVGVISGLLANSGGFLLAPSYSMFLRQPIKKAFACSLAVSSVLAIPGTIVHAYLGHVSWHVAGLIALGSVPSSYAGARLALRTRSAKLERLYGLMLTALGIFFLLYGEW
jgi:uncharacterized membrane protein YfcA